MLLKIGGLLGTSGRVCVIYVGGGDLCWIFQDSGSVGGVVIE